MNLTRLGKSVIISWDLDNLYEISLDYGWYSLDSKGSLSTQPGYTLTIKDKKNGDAHSFMTNGLSSEQRGGHNFPICP